MKGRAAISNAPDGDQTVTDQTVTIDSSLWPLLNLTSEPAFVALRRQYFGERIVDLFARTGQPLGHFQRTRSSIRGIPIESVVPLIGWESTGWLGCDQWTAAEWEQALAALRDSGGWDIFQSLWQSPHEQTQLDRAARSLGLPCLTRPSPLRVVHGFKSWDEFHQGMVKKKRVRYKNTMKALEKHGLHVTFDVSSEQIQNLYARRVLRMNASDNAKDERYQAFLRDWQDVLRKESRLEVVGVWHGDKLVAMALGFWRGRLFLFNYTAYDPAYQSASPGSIAIYKLLEVTLNKGAELFSFMGNYTYEKLFSSQTLESHRVDIFSRGLKGRLLHAFMKFKQNKQAEQGPQKA